MKTKIYPLEVCALHDLDDGSTMEFYSKGHHPVAEFLAELLKEHEAEAEPSKVKHVYMRWEMYAGPDGPCHVAAIHYTPGRGKFPVTFIYDGDWNWVEDFEMDSKPFCE
jgi:hypothetical protein